MPNMVYKGRTAHAEVALSRQGHDFKKELESFPDRPGAEVSLTVGEYTAFDGGDHSGLVGRVGVEKPLDKAAGNMVERLR